jgi:hypothetical protein
MLLLRPVVRAQQQHDMSGMKHNMTEMNHSDSTMNHSDSAMNMSHSLSRNLPMNRNGSGTSWHPDQTPMYAYMNHAQNSWMMMLHYSLFLRYTSQNSNNPGLRGNDKAIDAPNYVMGMAQRTVGQRGLFSVRAMLSLDPLTVAPNGYPLLFQSGESYNGQRLVDRQHQHDLFSELSVSYSYAISPKADAYVYLGYSGEPALGPPAFMHRISSFNNSDAPLGHHWMDATHITFGVATAGFRYGIAKIEASSFTGREPNENRYGFDPPRFDSYSFRLSVNPSPSLAVQVSHGFIKSPESLAASEDVNRTTASVLHSRVLGNQNRYVTSAFVWGLNSHDGQHENAYLAESSLQLNRVAMYGRYENITKSVYELGLLFIDDLGLPKTVNINNITAGINYRILRYANTDLVAGAQATLSMPDRFLQGIYGKTPVSGQVYLRLTPALMQMGVGNRTMHKMKH